MTIYTPDQIAAADQLAHANGHLLDILHNEPVDHGLRWDQWNDTYQDAWHKHESAEETYRALFGGTAPNAFEVLRASRELQNPLRPTLSPGTWRTRDDRFFVGRYLPGHPTKAGQMAVDFFELTVNAAPESFDVRRHHVQVDVADLEQAQQVVEQITWATAAGARTVEPAS